MTSWIKIHCNKCDDACNNGEEIYCQTCYEVLVDRITELEAQIEKLEEASNE